MSETTVRVQSRYLTGAYRVKPGDTLYSIAFESGVDYRNLAAWNGIEPPYRIRSGQVLRLSAPDAGPPAKAAAAPARSPLPGTPARSIKWSWPADGPVVQGFGGAQGGRGLDFAGNEGQPVRAAAGGKVVYAGSGLRGYGELIIVKHDETHLSAYAHNRRMLVQEGETVRAGQTIAEMGNSGSAKVRLHFEIRRHGTPVDPLTYLPKR